MSHKLDRRSFLSRTTGSLLATSMFPGAGLASGNPFAGRSPETQLSSGHLIPAPDPVGIFPRPHEMAESPGHFFLNEETTIMLPRSASDNDLSLARFLIEELSDWYGIQPRLRHEDTLPEGDPFILIGSISNPLVREYCRRHRPEVSAANPGPEGYFLQLSDHAVVVAGSDDRGAFYGLQSLRQLIHRQGGKLQVRGVQVRDWPDKPFRGVYLYVPGRDNIPMFKRFVRDFMARYKYNTLIMEMNACMRLDGTRN